MRDDQIKSNQEQLRNISVGQATGRSTLVIPIMTDEVTKNDLRIGISWSSIRLVTNYNTDIDSNNHDASEWDFVEYAKFRLTAVKGFIYLIEEMTILNSVGTEVHRFDLDILLGVSDSTLIHSEISITSKIPVGNFIPNRTQICSDKLFWRMGGHINALQANSINKFGKYSTKLAEAIFYLRKISRDEYKVPRPLFQEYPAISALSSGQDVTEFKHRVVEFICWLKAIMS